MAQRSSYESNGPLWVAAAGLGIALPIMLVAVMAMWALVLIAAFAAFVGTPIACYLVGAKLASLRVAAEPVVTRQRETAEILIPAPAPAIAAIPDFEASFETVSVTVARAHGTCPMGQTFEVGERYEFTNGHVEPGICPVAEKAIRPLVEQMRRGEFPEIMRPQCVTKSHEVVFMLEGVPVEEEEPVPA